MDGQVEPPMPVWMTVNFDRAPDTPANTKAKNKDPATYTLEPGETCNLTLTSRVETMELAKRLNEHAITLDDILILRVLGGRDHFLPVSGKFVQSGLDKTIDRFMQIPEAGMRRLQNQKPDGSGSGSGSSKSGKFPFAVNTGFF
jgi:phosphatidylinositol-bisphosphatase